MEPRTDYPQYPGKVVGQAQTLNQVRDYSFKYEKADGSLGYGRGTTQEQVLSWVWTGYRWIPYSPDWQKEVTRDQRRAMTRKVINNQWQ